ncbi:MAG: SUMF1/EgtB/PvdO family nonheme iron enzyme, partial [Leptospiraceae bacterium]|nr:SUMF1/EgtB/PvdO family nonheme iron enzyme [Leptospiraceae bacterium]
MDARWRGKVEFVMSMSGMVFRLLSIRKRILFQSGIGSIPSCQAATVKNAAGRPEIDRHRFRIQCIERMSRALVAGILFGLIPWQVLKAQSGVPQFEFVRIAAGSFYHSDLSWPNSGTSVFNKLYPVHITRAFDMQVTEVTQAQWKQVMGSLPEMLQYYKQHQGDSKPVVFVTHSDVEQFINKLNQMDSKHEYRLPYQSEWEYVA